MLLTLPAVGSCVVTVLALMVGVAALIVSSGPGWRELRWFGVSAISASVYGVCALETTLDVPIGTRAFVARLAGTAASFIIASAFVYAARIQGRGLSKWERILVGGVLVIAALWLVPGVCRTSVPFTRTVSWLGVAYTTTRPTPFGKLAYLLMLLATVALDATLFAAWRRKERGALAYLLAVSVQAVCGVNDALAAAGIVEMPYLLDIGQLVVVLAVGTTLIQRFLADARALERSSVALRAAQDELVRRERLAALGELSAIVAHEVRNPVTVIFGAVSTLRKQIAGKDATTLLDIVDEEAERLKRMVGELLDFARPRALVMDEVSPSAVTERAVDAALAGFGGDRSLVAIDVDRDVPGLDADEHLLRQALVNLVTNALQAPGRRGPVHIHVRGEKRPERAVAFDVVDDGEGVSGDVAEKMFTPFFTTRANGTGLGLAVVKRIAEAHRGEVQWERGEPRGVTFTLRIPARAAS